jgi:calcium/calmodulin-dependent protein kinase I
MLGVSQITSIHFEENDGNEIPFSDLFEYRTPIGSGGFGYVIAVLDKASGEEVALKLLNKETSSQKVIELFKKEAEILEHFDHPNIVKFKFFKNFSNFLCLGMELCLGGNLTEWIKSQRSKKTVTQKEYEEKCALIIKNIFRGVSYIHDSHEMIHRDLKPGNILFGNKDDLTSVKICDFGLANKMGTGLFDQNYEKVGTLMYQAPEQMNEMPSYGKPVDVWAVGMIMYELLTKGGHPMLGIDIHQNVLMTVFEYKEHMINNPDQFNILNNIKQASRLAKNLLKRL